MGDVDEQNYYKTISHSTASDLHVAIYSWNIDCVNLCAKNNKIINSFWRGCTPVSSALYLKRYKILQILVSNGANCNLCTRNNKMEPPLFAACRLRDKTAIDIILNSKDLNVDQQDFFGRSALWAAARFCSADIVQLLLDKGAKLNIIDCCYKKHPINGALQQSGKGSNKVINLLIRRGSFLDCVCEESPLKWAVMHVDREMFCLLVAAGCKIKMYDWLSYDKLPNKWLEDIPFCEWIDYLKKNPPTLFNITACLIRTILSTKWQSLNECHVRKLNLPHSLTSLILLQ